jgi:ribosomal protein S18 acetylase RimI-like enzyme
MFHRRRSQRAPQSARLLALQFHFDSRRIPKPGPNDGHALDRLPISGGGLRHTGILTVEKITVRRCQQRDIPAVLELWAQARSVHATTVDRLEDVRRLVIDSPAALLVAERNSEIVGTLIAAWDGWRGNMYRLAVCGGRRREGIGSALIQAGEAYLRSCGAHRVSALVASEDGVAVGFWESAGYPLDPAISRRVRNLH